jgi:hypothetical protein
VPAQWPVRSELFQFALAISLYTVAVTLSRITAFVAATLAAAAGQCGWLAPTTWSIAFELYGKRDRIDPRAEKSRSSGETAPEPAVLRRSAARASASIGNA